MAGQSAILVGAFQSTEWTEYEKVISFSKIFYTSMIWKTCFNH